MKSAVWRMHWRKSGADDGGENPRLFPAAPRSEAQSKALADRFNAALEASLQTWQQKHHAVILVSPAVVQGAPDITRAIQQDIARRMRAEP